MILHDGCLQNESVFTKEEEEKLEGALELDGKELELVVDTTAFILQQAAYHLAKSSLLKAQLTSIGLEEDKVRQWWIGFSN